MNPGFLEILKALVEERRDLFLGAARWREVEEPWDVMFREVRRKRAER